MPVIAAAPRNYWDGEVSTFGARKQARMEEKAMSEIDPRQFRDACSRFGTGVTVVSTHSEGADHGMTANAFMSISLDPPLIAISIGAKAKMLNKIRVAGRFAVSILAHGTEQTAWHFAGRPNEEL